MKNGKWYVIIVVLLVLAGVQAWHFYPLLPEKIATHFGPTGQPDGWMPKDAFMVVNAFFFLFMGGLFAGIGSLIRVLPSEAINLPNKDYWLAPERREASLTRMGNQMLSMGAATLFLLLAIMQMVFEANLLPVVQLDNRSWLVLVAYFIFTGFWTVGLLRQFSRPKND